MKGGDFCYLGEIADLWGVDSVAFLKEMKMMFSDSSIGLKTNLGDLIGSEVRQINRKVKDVLGVFKK